MAALSYLSCQEVIDFMADYREGELDPGIRRRFEEHLAVCPPCRDYLKTYESAVTMAKDLCHDPQHSVPEDLVQAILRACRQA